MLPSETRPPDCRLRLLLRSGLLQDTASVAIDSAESERHFAVALEQLLYDKFPTTICEISWHPFTDASVPFAYQTEGSDGHVRQDVEKKLPDFVDDMLRRPEIWQVPCTGGSR